MQGSKYDNYILDSVLFPKQTLQKLQRKRICMNRYTLDDNISLGTIFLIYLNGLHRLQRVHSINHLSYDCVNIVKLALPVVNDIELTFVRIWMLLRHRYHAATIKLEKYQRNSDLL